MNSLKPIEYFLAEETKYCETHKNDPEFMWNEEYGMQPFDMDDPLSFLKQYRFHRMYDDICSNREKYTNVIKEFNLSDSELLMLRLFIADMSGYFRDDNYNDGVPNLVLEMQKCLYSAIEKAPIFEGCTLYRFCVSEDKVNFALGQKYTITYSLTTTTDNWEQDTNRYIIKTLPKLQTNARCIYRIINHGGENQVNFLPNTSFCITKVKENKCGETSYKHIYMTETK
ncbi:MAG: hypothetical protein IJS05_00225 [Paludibacteraceae bacterium]|nr:hypothetical protein [Paludibacteraceae bacterium]